MNALAEHTPIAAGIDPDAADAALAATGDAAAFERLYRRLPRAFVYVPRNVSLDANTVNGDVTIKDLQSDVIARTVNGEIDVETTGTAVASTVNGSVDVVTGRNTWNGTLEFRTVNGDVSVTFPGDIDTEVSASTVNGDIETDWPLTVRGRFGSRSLNGTIGSGGRKIGLQTVNGDISLMRK